ncbi:tRNA-splicing endonuclease subunit Sen34 [Culicoides brevitarsis]|uniref:tRNA-splicing endonuclease subunit Sen34 n=1 Tax=Culicoides brevitarsis TaxID=469753 RepID=UPI00307C4E08
MEPIKLTFIRGRVFCFNGEDYFKIRYEHRVIGSLIGPGIGNLGNRDYKSLPATFTDVEAQFLVDKKFVVIVEKDLKSPPDEETKKKFHEDFQRQASEMKSFENDKAMTIFKENVQKIYEGQAKSSLRKRQKNEEFKKKSIEELISDHETKLANAPLRNRLVHVPTSHPFPVSETLKERIQVKNEFKLKVYHDLWERGHTITCGETFSGDFLCYPGDPLHFHASHIVTIVDRELSEPEMVVHGRTSVSVKKGCLLAYPENDGKIKYRTLKWVNPVANDMEIDEN